MKKISFFLGILLFTAGSVWSQGAIDIPMKLPTDSIYGPRSVITSPLAALEGTELVLSFSPATVSQIVIMDENNLNQVVYSGSFPSSTQVVVDLENEGVGKGIYLLWLYAFGEWWQGEFELTEE